MIKYPTKISRKVCGLNARGRLRSFLLVTLKINVKCLASYLNNIKIHFMLLQEAIGVFDDFVICMRNIMKPLNGTFSAEQIETSRASTFDVADVFEEFILNYGKLHLVGTRSSEEIYSHKLGESERDHQLS